MTKKTSTSKRGKSHESSATDTTHTTTVFEPEIAAQIERIIEDRVTAKIVNSVQAEIAILKKEITDDVIQRIMPLLETLKKIASEAEKEASHHHPGPDLDGDPTETPLNPAPLSLEQLQEATLKAMQDQEKLVEGSVDFMSELKRARETLYQTRQKGIKRFWLEQLVKNSSGRKGNSEK